MVDSLAFDPKAVDFDPHFSPEAREWLRRVVRDYTGVDPVIESYWEIDAKRQALRVQVDCSATGKRFATSICQPVHERNAKGICRYFKTYGWPQAQPLDPATVLAEAERAFADD